MTSVASASEMTAADSTLVPVASEPVRPTAPSQDMEMPWLGDLLHGLPFDIKKDNDVVYEQLTQHGFPRSALFNGDKILKMAKEGFGLNVRDLFAVADKLVSLHPEKAAEIYFEISTSGATTNGIYGVRPDLGATVEDRVKAFVKLEKIDSSLARRAFIAFRYSLVFTSVKDVLLANAGLKSKRVDTTTDNLVVDALDAIIHASSEEAASRGISFEDQFEAIQYLRTLGQYRDNDARFIARQVRAAYLNTSEFVERYRLVSLYLKVQPEFGDYQSIYNSAEEERSSYETLLWEQIMLKDGLINDMDGVEFMLYAFEDAGDNPGTFAQEAYYTLAKNEDANLDERISAYRVLEQTGSEFTFGANLIVGEAIQAELASLRDLEHADYATSRREVELIRAYRELNPDGDKELAEAVAKKSLLLSALEAERHNPDSMFYPEDKQLAHLRKVLGLDPELQLADISTDHSNTESEI